MNVCEKIYEIGGNGTTYGTTEGVCRITGKKSKGVLFSDWVKDTFNDHDRLYPGNIISNEAMFCFDESSEIIQKKTGREKPQRFRTYSHIIHRNAWHCLTKADKRMIFKLITEGAEVVCLTDSGQKHIFFKHKSGLWQLDDLYIQPNLDIFKLLHYHMCKLLDCQFSQKEIITGDYSLMRITKHNKNWKMHEDELKKHRGTGIFDFTSFMLYTDEKIQATPEPVKKSSEIKQIKLWD